MMRKLRKVFVIFFLLSLALPSMAFAQSATQEKITVNKDGSMKDEKGNPVDRKLFALSTYDADGKKQMEKGKARSRPETMYLDKALLNPNNLTEAQRKLIAEYIRAERQSGGKSSQASNQRRGRRPAQIVTIPTTLSDDDLEKLAQKVAAKIKIPANTGMSSQEFQNEVNKIVENSKIELRTYAANLGLGAPPGSVVTTQTWGEWFYSGFGWVASTIAAAFWFVYGILFTWITLAIIVALLLIVFGGPRTLRWYRSREKVPSLNDVAVSEDQEIVSATTSTSSKTTRKTKGSDKAFEPA